MSILIKNGFRALVLLLAIGLQISVYAGENITGPQFIKNKGQWDSHIQYLLQFNYGRLFIENGRVTYTLYSQEKDTANHVHPNLLKPKTGFVYRVNYVGSSPQAVLAGDAAYSYHNNYYIGRNRNKWASDVPIYAMTTYKGLYNGIDLTYKGNNDMLEYAFNIQPGADPSQIKMSYDKVLGDLRIEDNILKYSTPVTDIAEIQLQAYQYTNTGQDPLTQDQTPADQNRIPVRCNFKLEGNIVSFTFPDGYDKSLPLVIDPTLIFSSFSGSTMDNFGFTATYDNEGNAYMGGIAVNGALEGYPADTIGYPVTSGAFQPLFGGGQCDDAITKLNPDGTGRIYATYLGGSGSETPNSMVVNNNNELLVFGVTSSPDFPVSSNAFDTTFHGGTPDSLPDNGAYFELGTDIYVTKFDSAGHMLASTLYGGSGNDGLNWTGYAGDADVYNESLLAFNYSDAFRGEIEVDSANNVYVASCTSSPTLYPKIGSSIRDQLSGPQDGIVFKMNADLSSLTWQTYVGGSNYDALYSLDLDAKNNVYAAGGTMSNDFATTSGAINPSEPGGRDGILVKIAANGSAIQAATYLGTPAYDQAYFVKLGPDSNVYVTGQTLGNYPVSNGVYSDPNSTQFIHCLTPSLDTTVFSTVFGNGDPSLVNMCPTAFLVDECGLIYVCGWGGTVNNSGVIDYYGELFDATFYGNDSTGSVAGMPIDTPAAIETNSYGSDFYLIVLGYRASNFVYGTYIGSDSTYSVSHVDGGTSRFDKTGVIYEAVCASCFNSGFFTTPGVVATGDSSFNCNEAVVKMATQLSPVTVQVQASPSTTGCAPFNVNFNSRGVNVINYTWSFGDSTTSTQPNPVHQYTTPGTYHVTLVGTNPTICPAHAITDTSRITVIVKGYMSANPLPTDSGCEPLAYIDTPAITGSTSAAIYTWNFGDGTPLSHQPAANHVFDSSGIYTVSLMVTDTNNCDTIHDSVSVDVIFSTLRAAFRDSILRNVCDTLEVGFINESQGDTAILWNFGDGDTSLASNVTHTYNQAGTYQIRLIALRPNGCKLLDTAYSTVTLKPPLKAAITSPDTSGCAPFKVTLTSRDSGTAALNYSWNFGDGTPVSTSPDPTHTFDSSGNYQVILTSNDTGTCNVDIIDTIVIQVPVDSLKAAFTIQVAKDVCDTLQIAAVDQSQDATSIVWYYGNNDSSSSPNISYTYYAPGVYQVELVARRQTGCRLIDTAIQTVMLKPQLYAGISSPDTLGCFPLQAGFSIHDSGESGAINYSWNFGDGSPPSTSANPVHTFENVGTYQVILTATDTGTCNVTVVDTISITVRADTLKPGFTLNVLKNVCDTLNIQLTNQSVNAASVSWSFGDGDTSSANSPSHSYHAPGTYVVIQTVTGKYCGTIDTSAQDVTLEPQVIALFTPQNGCLPFSYQPVNASTNAMTYLWQYQSNTSTESSPVISYDTAGTYHLSLTAYNPNTCNDSNTYSASVKVFSTPFAAFVTDSTHYDVFSNVKFTNKSTVPASYTWNFGDGTTSNDSAPVHQYATDGIMIPCLTVVDSNQCQAEICDTITIDFVAVVDVPTAFSPNGDGINDVLYVKGYGVAELDFRIYNRWGELVFQSTSLSDGWDGTFRGSPQAMDVYAYTLQATFQNGVQTPLRKGNITLLR